MRTLLAFALLLSSLTAHSASASPGAFFAVDVRAPPPGTPARRLLLLLYGNQGAQPDPTWMADLPVADSVVVAPALAGADYDWERPATRRALALLVDRLVAQHHLSDVYVLGYSAGASRVLGVARALHHVSGVIAVAGDILRSRPRPADLRSLRILLVCMRDDPGPHTSCALNRHNRAALEALGAPPVRLEILPGGHALDLTLLAPLVDAFVL